MTFPAKALIEKAKWHLAANRPEQAIYALDRLSGRDRRSILVIEAYLLVQSRSTPGSVEWQDANSRISALQKILGNEDRAEVKSPAAGGDIRIARTEVPRPIVRMVRALHGGIDFEGASVTATLRDLEVTAFKRDVPTEDDEAPSDRKLEFTPHLDVEPAAEKHEFRVAVFLDQLDFREGEIGTNVSGYAGTSVQVILMVSDHFEVVGPRTRTFVLENKERIDVPPFRLKRSADVNPLATDPAIAALFSVGGRSCGVVSRLVTVNGAPTTKKEGTADRLDLQPVPGEQPDLTVTVVANPINDGRQFFCTVQSPHVEELHDGVSAPWNLPDKAENIVVAHMTAFTLASSSGKLVDELRGAGGDLFAAAPANFQEAFWKLIDAGVVLRTIAIVSEEPYVPWELMVPKRFREKAREPLGVEFSIGRWAGKRIAAERKISLRDSAVIAPMYDGDDVLQTAEDEAAFVTRCYPGKMFRPALYDDVVKALKYGSSLIHFVCHGKDVGTGGQKLKLDNNESISAVAVAGLDGVEETFLKTRPIVFLNACELGRGNPALVGPGGFAARFIGLGAAAVIAPLWSVEDDIAHQIALDFYGALKERPDLPMAEVFSSIRAKAYDGSAGKDTYAAYCFYGDPLATAAS